MKHIALFIILLAALGGAYASGNAPVPPPQHSLDAISAGDAKQHLYFLAADSMQGRNTPSPQLNIAAHYIADHFKEYGLQPVNGSYLFPYTVSRINLDTTSSLKMSHGEEKISFALKNDWNPFEMTGNGNVSGSIVFAGYGITAPEYNYDDYKDIDVRGKIVFVL